MSRRGHTRIMRYDTAAGTLVTTRAILEVLPAEGEPRRVEVDAGRFTIGTDPGNDLVVDDRFASGGHAEIAFADGEFVLTDLDSTNGTRIGGAKIDRAALPHGGEFTIGTTRFRIEIRQESDRVDESKPAETGGIVGKSPGITRALSVLARVAPSGVPVLITGETGTGKELAARLVHRLSERRDGPFMAVNCGAISPDLVESELFGHVKGAFTSATNNHTGLVEAASGGTLFLDEIGEMPLALQAKLLRVLEDGILRPVGSTKEVHTDARIVAATNQDLARLVDQKLFRRDLFYRVFGVAVPLPPLRERGTDVVELARHFLVLEAARRGVPRYELTDEAAARLTGHPWPGNVRELRRAMEVASSLAARPPVIGEDDLSLMAPFGAAEFQGDRTLEEIEADAIRVTLVRHNGNTRETAEVLGIGLSTLYDKMKKHGIVARTFRTEP